MRCRKRFVPWIELLERLELLASYEAEIAGFNSPIAADRTSDSSGDTAWGFPGMSYNILTQVPSQGPDPDRTYNYSGFKKITYTASAVVQGSYSMTSGSYSTSGTAKVFILTNSSTIQHGTGFSAPKDAGSVTIRVEAEIWIAGPIGPPSDYDTVTDTLTVKVETPLVEWFKVSNDSGSQDPASPLWFGRASVNPPTPNSGGAALAFMMVPPAPFLPTRDGVGFWAKVTNKTQYTLKLGYIQEIDIDARADFTNGLYRATSGNDGLDRKANTTTFFYDDQVFPIQPNATSLIPPSGVVADAPSLSAFASETNSAGAVGWLTNLRLHYQFRTNLAVQGGSLPSGGPSGPSVSGLPIGLSTATWHLDGRASNANATSYASTLNRSNWTVSLSASSGTSPGPNDPWTNGSWYAIGDNTSKYLTWSFLAGDRLATWERLQGPYAPAGIGGSTGGAEAVAEETRGEPMNLARWNPSRTIPVPKRAVPRPSDPIVLYDAPSVHYAPRRRTAKWFTQVAESDSLG